MASLIHILILTIPLLVVAAVPYPTIFPKAIAFFLLIDIFVLSAIGKMIRSKTRVLVIPRSFAAPHFASIAFFLAAALLTTVLGADPIRSLFSDQIRMTGVFMLLHAIVWFILLSVFFQQNSNRWLTLGIISTLVAYGVVLYAVVQKFALFPGWTLLSSHNDRVTSTLGNPIFLGHYLLLSIWLAALAAAHEKRAYVRRILSAFIPIAFFIILLTANRSTVAIATVGILFFAVYSLKKKYISKIFLAVIIITIVAIPLFFTSKQFSSFWEPTIRVVRDFFNEKNRPILWSIGMRSLLQKPFIGWGNGNFDYAYYSQVRIPEEYAILPRGIPDNSHNTFIEILVTSGTVGLLSFLFALMAVIWCLAKIFQKGDTLGILSGLYLAAFFISAILQDLTIFDTPSTIMLLSFGFALLHLFSSQGSQNAEQSGFTFYIPRPLAIIAFAGVGAVILFLVAIPAYASYLSKKAWGVFPYDIRYGMDLHTQAIQLSNYLAPEIRQVFISNVIANYDKTAHDEYLLGTVLPLALAEARKSFSEHPLSMEWIKQYAALLRIDIGESGRETSRKELSDLLSFALSHYPRYPDIRFEQLQYFLAINDTASFQQGVLFLSSLLPSDGRTDWFVAISFLMKDDIPSTVDNLLESERKGYDIFTQARIWRIIATKAQGEQIQRIRDILARAVEHDPSNEGLRDALRVLREKK